MDHSTQPSRNLESGNKDQQTPSRIPYCHSCSRKIEPSRQTTNCHCCKASLFNLSWWHAEHTNSSHKSKCSKLHCVCKNIGKKADCYHCLPLASIGYHFLPNKVSIKTILRNSFTGHSGHCPHLHNSPREPNLRHLAPTSKSSLSALSSSSVS